jgi:signal-induced proliferation-associated 1 like protein 1
MRGSILEDCIPSTSKLSSARGLCPKDILEYVVPSLNVSCLRHAIVGPKTCEQLVKLDEQRVPLIVIFSSFQTRVN